MQQFFTGLFFLSIISLASAAEVQKQEGQCSGQLLDGSEVSFTYYSDYNGCQESILSSIKFSPESGLGNQEGNRKFENRKDIYSFAAYGLSFNDSTGNNSGVFEYFNVQGNKESITVQCVIQDFEYGDCLGITSPH